MTCKNCSQEATQHFCSNCGQKTTVARLTMAGLASQLSEGVFQINRGFFFTMKELTVRPGVSIRAFLEGKRKNHFKPIAYAFLISTIYFLISRALGTETVLNDAISGFAEGGSDAADLSALNWFADRYSYTILLFLPVYAFASFLAFKGRGYNFVEHVVLNAYILGHQSLIYILYAIASYATGDTEFLAMLMVILSISYQLFVFVQFFSRQSRISVSLRSFATYVLYFLFLTPVLLVILWLASIIK